MGFASVAGETELVGLWDLQVWQERLNIIMICKKRGSVNVKIHRQQKQAYMCMCEAFLCLLFIF